MRPLSLSCGFGVLLALAGCGSDADSGLFDTTNAPPAGSSGAAGGTSTGGKGGSSAGAAGKGGKAGTSQAGGFAGSAAGSDDVGGAGGDNQGGQGGEAPAGAGGEGGASGQGGAATTGGQGGAGTTSAGGQSAGGQSVGGSGGGDVGGAAGSGQSGAGPAGMSGSSGQGGSGQSGAGQGGAGQGGAGQGGAGGQSGAAGSGTTSPLDSCPGEAVTLAAGKTTLTGDTSTLKNDTSSGGNQCGGSNSNDAVYAMTASAAGRVTLVLTGTKFSPTVYVRKACTDQGNVLCDAGQTDAQITFFVNKGSSFAVFVDGYGTGNQAGPYTLTATLEPSVCGNGNLEVGEQCDDGNAQPGDGCDDTCQLEASCKVNDGLDTSYTSPGALPAGCSTIDVSNVKITSDNGNLDNDWYCAQVNGGQTLTAQTYTGSPGACSVEPNNTFLEIYRNKPQQAPSGNICQNSNALACNDDIGQNNGFQGICSLTSYKVPEGQGGTYCIRVTRGTIPESGSTINYGLTVTIQ